MDQKDRAAIAAALGEDVVISRINIKGRSYGPCYCCGRDLGVGCSVIGLSGDQDLKACSKSVDGHEDSRECRRLAGERFADLERQLGDIGSIGELLAKRGPGGDSLYDAVLTLVELQEANSKLTETIDQARDTARAGDDS